MVSVHREVSYLLLKKMLKTKDVLYEPNFVVRCILYRLLNDERKNESHVAVEGVLSMRITTDNY